MTAWAVWDRLVPVAAVLLALWLGYRLGRGSERLDWLTGKRSCGHDPDCADVRVADFDAGLDTLAGERDRRRAV